MKQRARHAVERLDAAEHDERELAQSLDQVAAVNRFLGGTRAALRAIDALSPPGGTVRILDVGCGSGDVPHAIAAHFRRSGRALHLTATDLHPQILEIARRRLAHDPALALARVDARNLPFRRRAFDIAIMSLTLHHFEDPEPVLVLRELARVASVVIVNDLDRRWPNYLGARALALTLWAGNPLTRHDGPLSVRRSFSADELAELGRRAGLHGIRVRRRFFYRLVMSARSADSPDT